MLLLLCKCDSFWNKSCHFPCRTFSVDTKHGASFGIWTASYQRAPGMVPSSGISGEDRRKHKNRFANGFPFNRIRSWGLNCDSSSVRPSTSSDQGLWLSGLKDVLQPDSIVIWTNLVRAVPGLLAVLSAPPPLPNDTLSLLRGLCYSCRLISGDSEMSLK